MATMKTTLALVLLAVAAVAAAVPSHDHNNRFLGKSTAVSLFGFRISLHVYGIVTCA